MTTVDDLFTKYNCTNCQDDIQGIRIHCAECENFDLCLHCFSAGAEIGTHQNNHAYQFMDSGTTILSVFRGKGAWAAREEIRLLDAIEQYGFGNWEDISKHIETKSAEDAKEEYVEKFVNGTIGRHTWIPAQSQRPLLMDHTSEDAGPLGSSALQRLPPLDITTEEAAQLGYMPNRDSFEREYDPTAEQLISTLSLNNDDTECDYLLKMAHVDLYTRRLRDRVRRKRLVRDYQLVANFFHNRNYSQFPGMTKEQKEFRDRLRVFAQFYTANEYERLLNSLERENELRLRLSELSRYRYNGLTKIAECRHFEQHVAAASLIAQHKRHNGKAAIDTGPYGQGKTDNIPHHITAVTGAQQRPIPDSSSLSPQQLSQKPVLLSDADTNSSSIAPNSMLPIEDPTSCAASSLSRNYLDSCRVSPGHTMTTTMMMMTPATIDSTTTAAGTNLQMMDNCSHQSNYQHQFSSLQLQLQQEQQQQLMQSQLQSGLVLPGTNAGALGIQAPMPQIAEQLPPPPQLQSMFPAAAAPKRSNRSREDVSNHLRVFYPTMSEILRAQLEELKHLPQPLGSDLLSRNEQLLCKKFNLPPTSYLSLKTLLLSGSPVITSRLSPVESSLRKYFIKVGWLSH